MNQLDIELLTLIHRTHSPTMYALRKNLDKTFGIHLSFGTIHPRLIKLVREKALSRRKERRKHGGKKPVYYSITDRGRKALKEAIERLSETTETLETLEAPLLCRG